MSEPKTVFHYTDAQGFLAMTRSRTMWASCLECLNDEREFRHGLDLAAHLSSAFVQPDVPHAQERADYLTKLLTGLWGMAIFSCSFSAQGDLLSQWRGYCGSGNGYNVGLNLERLKEFCAAHNLILKPCIYDRKEQISAVRPVLEALFAGDLDDPAVEPLQERLKKASDAAAYMLRDIAPFLKDEAFREEEEWRLVSYVWSHEDPRWKVRPGKTTLVSYVDIDFSACPEVFAEVTVGPGPYSRDKLHFITVQHMLNIGLGPAAQTRVSKVPYRFW